MMWQIVAVMNAWVGRVTKTEFVTSFPSGSVRADLLSKLLENSASNAKLEITNW
jgi:hypothetical protein